MKAPTRSAIVVADAGPLIALAGVRRLELLAGLFEHTIVPYVVRDEIAAPPAGRLGAEEFLRASWLESLSPSPPDPFLAASLDEGEASVISLARTLPNAAVLIDERRGGRVAATAYRLQVTGTGASSFAPRQQGCSRQLRQSSATFVRTGTSSPRRSPPRRCGAPASCELFLSMSGPGVDRARLAEDRVCTTYALSKGMAPAHAGDLDECPIARKFLAPLGLRAARAASLQAAMFRVLSAAPSFRRLAAPPSPASLSTPLAPAGRRLPVAWSASVLRRTRLRRRCELLCLPESLSAMTGCGQHATHSASLRGVNSKERPIMSWHDSIRCTAGRLEGKPHIIGTEVLVADVLDMIASGHDVDAVCRLRGVQVLQVLATVRFACLVTSTFGDRFLSQARPLLTSAVTSASSVAVAPPRMSSSSAVPSQCCPACGKRKRNLAAHMAAKHGGHGQSQPAPPPIVAGVPKPPTASPASLAPSGHCSQCWRVGESRAAMSGGDSCYQCNPK